MAKYKFEDIAINSKLKKKPVEEDKYHYIGLEHLDSGSLEVTRYGSEVAPKGEKLIMKKGDVLFGKRRAYQKKVGIAPFDGIFSAHGMVLRPKENVIDKNFFPLFISSDYFLDAAIKISVGSLSPTINWSDLKELEFELPDLAGQKKLAKILWAAEETKQAYKTLLQKTDDMVKAKFEAMFGDPIKNDKNWKYSFLPEVTTIVLGSTPRTNVSEYWNGNIKWVTPAELTNDTFIINDTIKHISEKGKKSANLTLFPKNTVIFSTRAPIGKTAIAGCPMCCNQGFKNFICSEHINHIYLYYVLKNNKDYFISLGTGTTFKELPKAKIEKIAISIPTILLQKKFEYLYLQAEQSKQQLQKSLNSLNTMTKALINENLK